MRPGHVPKIRSLWFRWRQWFGIAVLGPVVVLVLLSPQAVSEDSVAGILENVLGWLLLVAGVALRSWATLYLGGRRGRVLVDQGPYSLVRNPLYLGSFFIAGSVAAFLHSVTAAIGILVVAAIYVVGAIPAEERALEAALGEEYRAYRASTRRFLPRFSRFRTDPRVDVSVRALKHEALRASRVLWIPVLHEVVGRLRFASWWPHLFQLP